MIITLEDKRKALLKMLHEMDNNTALFAPGNWSPEFVQKMVEARESGRQFAHWMGWDR